MAIIFPEDIDLLVNKLIDLDCIHAIHFDNPMNRLDASVNTGIGMAHLQDEMDKSNWTDHKI